MCLMDYEFHVLDNAFLIHRPGIKTVKNNPTKPNEKQVAKQNNLIAKVIKPEIEKAFGIKKGCVIKWSKTCELNFYILYFITYSWKVAR